MIDATFFQACKVAGKNSTPCHELKKEGTDVILIDMDPARFYEVNCDCVGILKERASDIENKKPHQTRRTNWRKKTTKVIILPDSRYLVKISNKLSRNKFSKNISIFFIYSVE